MKSSLQYLSFFLVLSLLASCNGLGISLNYDGDSNDEKENKKAAKAAEAEKIKAERRIAAHILTLGLSTILHPGLLVLEEVEVNSPQKEFLLAASKGKVGKVKKILDEEEVDINMQDENGDTALIIAARYGRITLVERLIERRANLNLKNYQGQTALMVAIAEGHEAVALALIAERKKDRINLNLKDNDKWSALKYARKGKHKTIEKELLRNGAEEYLISKKIKKGAKRVLLKAAEKVPEVAPAALL